MKYFEYVARLKHSEQPDYAFCRKLFEKELKENKCPVDGKLEFTTKGSVGRTAKKQVKTKIQEDEDDEVENDVPVKRARGKRNTKKVAEEISDSDDDSGRYVNGLQSTPTHSKVSGSDEVREVDRSKFVYRAGEYKRLPPDQRPYKLKKAKTTDS